MLVIAHRGASHDLPENTLPAFERAIEMGADFVEFDVHNDLERHARPAAARASSYPTLAEALDLCHGRIGVMVELKRPRGDTVRRALALMHDDDVLVCFQRRALEEAHALRGRQSARCSTSGSASRSAGQPAGGRSASVTIA